ncbi:polysaccharide deacetylase family protein [Priestia megaterium]|uniref:polysaccharide deacetylase family protein n=1 Tax=Priestia megaterium TaxID=1404 RepID=UPI0037093E2C
MRPKPHEHPHLLKTILPQPHPLPIHTYSHPNLLKQSTQNFHCQIPKTHTIIKDITPFQTHLFPPPYPNLTQQIITHLPNQNLYPINSSSHSLHSNQIPQPQITNNLFNNIHPPTILFIHDPHHSTIHLSNTPNSLHTIIPTLKQQAYHFLTLPQLFHIPYPKN